MDGQTYAYLHRLADANVSAEQANAATELLRYAADLVLTEALTRGTDKATQIAALNILHDRALADYANVHNPIVDTYAGADGDPRFSVGCSCGVWGWVSHLWSEVAPRLHCPLR